MALWKQWKRHARWWLSLCLGLHASMAAAAPDQTIQIELVRDGPSATFDSATELLQSELEAFFGPGFQWTVRDGDWTKDGIDRILAREEQPDVRITMGALAAHSAHQSDDTAVRTVVAYAPFFLLEPNDRTSLAFGAPLMRLNEPVQRLLSLHPVQRIGVVVDPSLMHMRSKLEADLRSLAAETGVAFEILPWDGSPPQQALEAWSTVDALLLAYTPRATRKARADLIATAMQQKRAVVAAFDPNDIEAGALLTCLPENATALAARQVALTVQALWEEGSSEGLSLLGGTTDRYVLNARTLDRLGLQPSFEVLSEAEIWGRPHQSTEALNFAAFVEEASQRNPTLLAQAAIRDSGASQLHEARGLLFPSIDAEARGVWIDRDRGEGPFPPAERTATWGVRLRQGIYAPEVMGGYGAAAAEQRGREAVFASQELDVLLRAATSYIDLLRAITEEEVQRENLQRVRANLTLARVQERVGVVGREEVYRWQIQLAQSQESLVRAHAARLQGNVLLNQLRDVEPNRDVVVEEKSFQDIPVLASDARLAPYVDQSALFAQLEAFVAQRALTESPDVEALQKQVEAARKLVSMRRQVAFLPSLSLEGGLDHRFYLGGAGSNVPNPGFTVPDSVDWSVGLVARLPLLAGGSDLARIDGAHAQLRRLEAEQRAVLRSVTGNARQALLAARASRRAMLLSRRAAEAAARNQALVRDAYSRGRLDVIRLIDAQTQSLTTALAEANATFEFLQDFLRVERAMGQLSFGRHGVSTDTFFADLAAFESSPKGTSP